MNQHSSFCPEHPLFFSSHICPYPSSRYTSAMVWKQVRYLISPGTGWGPWIRLLATSKGIFTQEEMVPDNRPMVNLRRNSRVGS